MVPGTGPYWALMSTNGEPGSAGYEPKAAECRDARNHKIRNDDNIPLPKGSARRPYPGHYGCPMEYILYFHPVSFFLLLFLFPRLISAVIDWMSTISTHGVALVRI